MALGSKYNKPRKYIRTKKPIKNSIKYKKSKDSSKMNLKKIHVLSDLPNLLKKKEKRSVSKKYKRNKLTSTKFEGRHRSRSKIDYNITITPITLFKGGAIMGYWIQKGNGKLYERRTEKGALKVANLLKNNKPVPTPNPHSHYPE